MEELKEIMSTCKDFFFAGFKAANSCKNEEDEKEKTAKNEDTDKRKLIDEVAGIMKSGGCDDELIRTAIGKMEKLSYDKSSQGTADNSKAKNEDEEEKDKEDEEAKNKAKNEDDEDKETEYEDFKEKIKEEAENKKAKNSLDDLTKQFYQGHIPKQKIYMTQKEGIELGKKLY